MKILKSSAASYNNIILTTYRTILGGFTLPSVIAILH